MYIKLSEYAKMYSVTYKTAWNWFKSGKIPNAFKKGNSIYVSNNIDNSNKTKRAALYARVSNNDAKDNLHRQLERLTNFAVNNGYTITKTEKEIASGLNDSRKKLNNLFMNNNDWDVILVENKDRLTRFGFNYIETLLKQLGKELIVINKVNDDKSDLMQDLISIIYSFSARMYGLRKKKNKEDIKKFIEE